MLMVRRAQERRHSQQSGQASWLSFDASAPTDPLSDGFSSLQQLTESRLAPGARGLTRPPSDAEMLSYVLEGSLVFDDSVGRSGVLNAGEFCCMTSGRSVSCNVANASKTDGCHFLRVCLHSRAADAAPSQEQQRFSAAQRRGKLCLVASRTRGRARSSCVRTP